MLLQVDTSYFCTNYIAISTNFYCTHKIGEILNLTIFVRLSLFCNSVILGEHIIYISKRIFPKVILHLRISNQLHDVRLQEFYIHAGYLINIVF